MTSEAQAAPSINPHKQPTSKKHKARGYRGVPVTNIKSLARVHAPAAIATLQQIMCNNDASHSARIAAATELLNRGFGKPAQSIEAVSDKRIEVIIKDATASPSELVTDVIDVTPSK